MKKAIMMLVLLVTISIQAQYNTENWESHSYVDSSDIYFKGIYSEGKYYKGKIEKDLLVYTLITEGKLIMELYVDGILTGDSKVNYIIVEQQGKDVQAFTCYMSKGVLVVKESNLLIDIINKGNGEILKMSVNDYYVNHESNEKFVFTLKTMVR